MGSNGWFTYLLLQKDVFLGKILKEKQIFTEKVLWADFNTQLLTHINSINLIDLKTGALCFKLVAKTHIILNACIICSPGFSARLI